MANEEAMCERKSLALAKTSEIEKELAVLKAGINGLLLELKPVLTAPTPVGDKGKVEVMVQGSELIVKLTEIKETIRCEIERLQDVRSRLQV